MACTSMSAASGSYTAPSTWSGRSTGTISRACSPLRREAPVSMARSTSQWASSSAMCSAPATIMAPRGVSSGCSAKPSGGCSRNARLAIVSARTCAVP
jgi:hypothetical protein